MLENIAIILAAGTGKRFASSLPKQYNLIYNKPIIYYSLLTFLQHDLIHKVLTVINKEHEDIFVSFLNKYKLLSNNKLLPYVFGGESRKDSVFNALKNIENLENKNTKNTINNVLIHDSARPFVSNNLITNVINSITKNQGCIPVLKINDSLKKIDNNYIIDSLNRDAIVKAQTPQGFPFSKLLNSYKNNSDCNVTDDAEIIAKSNLKVAIINGSLLNEKITTKENLQYLEKLTSSVEYRTGQGFDVHAFSTENNVDLYLGGIKIPNHKGLLGHSDADVVLHALVDAILGALAKGDIGDYFPPSDDKWKGAPSSIFLIKAKELLQDNFATITNIDITVLCETPKITSYKKLIINNIANIINVEPSIINIKATTTENLGFIGRKEGIAAMANILILLKNNQY